MKPDRTAALRERVAKKILSETLGVRKGENVTIEVWNNGLDLGRSLSLEAKRMGALPLVVFEDENAYVQGVKSGHKASVGAMGKHEFALLARTDAFVFVPGPPLSPFYKGLTPKERSDSTKYNHSWYQAAKKAKLRGARLGYGFLGKDAADTLGKTVEQIELQHLSASLVDLKKISRKSRKVSEALRDGAKVRLETPGAKLLFTTKGEFEIDDGVVDDEDLKSGNNMAAMPPGSFYKEVDPKSVRGTYRLSPFKGAQGSLKDGLLVFRKGRLVKWTSEKSQEVLDRLVAQVPEKDRRMIGLMVGINPRLHFGYGVNQFSAGTVMPIISGRGLPTREGTLTARGKTLVSHGRLR